jgi:geranylgeranyl diphosphate synthase type 3
MNLSSSLYAENKGLCEDLTEGKFSFPIIHSIRSDPSNLQLINILKQKTTDDEVKRYAVKYMEGTGSFEYCRRVLGTLMEKAKVLIDELEENGDGKGVRAILDRIVV